MNWEPFVVEQPTTSADAYFVDTNPGKVLVSRRLAVFLKGIEPQLKTIPVKVEP